jgi:hypothetical protein
MTYREERIRIRLTVGIATSAGQVETVSHLIGVAVQRLAQGRRPAATASWAKGEITADMLTPCAPAGQHRPAPAAACRQPGRCRACCAAPRRDPDPPAAPGIDRIRSHSGLPLAKLASFADAELASAAPKKT